MNAPTTRPLTGRGVLTILVAAFGVIVGANATLAWYATGSFPGLVVANSYVASQHFDSRRAALEARGWRTRAGWQDGALVLEVLSRHGHPVRGLAVTARLGRPASALTDRALALGPTDARYSAEADLAPGRWGALFTIDDGSGAPVELQSTFSVPSGDR